MRLFTRNQGQSQRTVSHSNASTLTLHAITSLSTLLMDMTNDLKSGSPLSYLTCLHESPRNVTLHIQPRPDHSPSTQPSRHPTKKSVSHDNDRPLPVFLSKSPIPVHQSHPSLLYASIQPTYTKHHRQLRRSTRLQEKKHHQHERQSP